MEQVFKKIILVSLCDEFTVEVGKLLSQNLDMLFCDTKDLVEYELINKDALKKISTPAYLKTCEKRVMEHLASFENVVVVINFDYLIRHLNILKSESIIVFLNLQKRFIESHSDKLALIAYDDWSAQLKKISLLTLDVKNYDATFVCNKIIDAIGGIL